MTGTVATQSYLSPTTPAPSVFSTLWSGIDLPALWFWFVAVFLKLGGTSLAMLRLPPALFGAATVISLYALLRGTWGRYAAIAGSTIMAFSVSNVHYSRLALNNIVTQFFWATCFLFLLRALWSRRRSDWALAGLSAGLSEYFYYGTRLLPFISAMFMVFLVARCERSGRGRLRARPVQVTGDRRTTLAVITETGREVVERATEVLNAEVFTDIGLSERRSVIDPVPDHRDLAALALKR